MMTNIMMGAETQRKWCKRQREKTNV